MSLLLLLSLNQAALAQWVTGQFVDVTNKVPENIQYNNGTAAWADYDGDGLQDFFIIGKGETIDATLFHNTGNGRENVTPELFTELPGGLQLGSVTWGDYDRDKRPDLLLTGAYGYGLINTPYSALFHNTPNGFKDVTKQMFPEGLPQLTQSSAAWGDINGDSLLDLVMTGKTKAASLSVSVYINQKPNPFSDVTSHNVEPLEVMSSGSVTLADFNNDGKLDLAMSGKSGNDYQVKFYTNLGFAPFFRDNGTYFNITDHDVPEGGSMAWGDYDNDKKLDLILTGTIERSNGLGTYRVPWGGIYHNKGTGFSDVTWGLLIGFQMNNSAVAWFDFNNDGHLDLFMSGETGSRRRSRLLLNSFKLSPDVAEGLSDAIHVLPDDVANTAFNSVSVADYDNDGRPDLLLTGSGTTRILRNEVTKRIVGGNGLVNMHYGGSAIDRFTAVIQTADGGYLSGGYSNSPVSGDKSQSSSGGADYWIVKTDKDGTKQWDQRYGGTNHDYLNRIIPTLDGGYLLAGSSTSGVGGDKSQDSRGNQDYWIVKISSNGTKQWDQTYGGSGFDDLRKVNQLANGDYLLAGTSSSPVSGEKSQSSQGGTDYWVVRVSSTGEKLWDHRYGGSKNEHLESFTKTSGGGFLLAGSSASGQSGDKSQSSKGGNDYWLVRIDQDGQQLWDKSYGGSGDEELYSIGITSEGEYFVAGHSTSGQSGDKSQASQGSSDYWMLKLTSSGDKLWDKSFGGSGVETLRSIIQVQGGYVLAGSSDSNISGDKTQASRGGSDYWIVKTDAAGNKEYDYRFGGAADEEFRYIQRTSDGGLLLGGRSDSGVSGDRTQPSQGSTDYWLVKLDPGKQTSSPAARVMVEPELTTPNQQVYVYPNPTADKLTVKLTRPAQQVQTSITDLTGTVRKSNAHRQVDSSTLEIMVSQLPAAVYLLQLQTEHGRHTLKFVKQ